MSPFIQSYKSMKMAYWLVVLIFLLLPWAAMSNKALPLLLIIIPIIISMVYRRRKGATFVVMAIGLCIPFVARMDDATGTLFANYFKWLNRALYISIIISYFIYLSRKKYQWKKLLPGNALILISICLFVDGLRFGFGEGFNQIYTILTVPIMFYICYRGNEEWNDIFQMFSVFFFALAVYAILDFVNMGPYEQLQMGTTLSIADLFRTGSLLENSLCFTAFLMAYHAVLLIDYYLTKSFSPWLVASSILITLFTGSRTAFIVLAAIWIMFILYLNRGLKGQGKIIAIMLFVAVVLVGVVLYFFGDYITMFFERFSEGSDHRESGFQTTMNIFSAHPLGLGYSGIGEVLELYAAEGWSGGMKTVDNIYLTMVITSGVFCMLPFLFYYFIPLNALTRSFRRRDYRIVVMLFIPYMLCGLSFNINSFIQINILYFGIAGHMYRIIQNRTIYGLVNNNS